MALSDRIANFQEGAYPALNAAARFALAHYDGLPMSYFPSVAAPRVWARIAEILPTLADAELVPLSRETGFLVDETLHAHHYSNCALCGEDMPTMDDTMQYPCPEQHQFHTTCMQQVDFDKCPICLYTPSNYSVLEREMMQLAPNYTQLLVLESSAAVFMPVKNDGPMIALKRLLLSPDVMSFSATTVDELERWYGGLIPARF